LVKALPKLAKAAQSEDLAEALRSHLTETEGHVKRLEKVFGVLGVPAKGKSCKAMKGLVEEGGEAAQEEAGELRDLAIIAGGQRVEHYEISAYGTARTLAERLNLNQAAELLQKTEDEEIAADSKLTEIAMSIYDSSDSEDEEETVGVGTRAGRGHAKSGGRNSSL